MLKKTMTYEDFDGNMRTEDFYFNLTKAECAELEFGVKGGLTEMLNKILEEKDLPRIIEIIKKFILQAYGVKSSDGKRFIKNDELREAFSQTNAYSDLFMEYAFDAKSFAEFIQGVIPNIPDDIKEETEAKIKELVEGNSITPITG